MGDVSDERRPGWQREDAPAIVLGGMLVLVAFILVFVTSSDWITKEDGTEPNACFAYLGHCADVWTATGTIGLFAATIVLVIVGYIQVRQILYDSKINRSLVACERYTFDPLLDSCLRKMSLSGPGTASRSDAVTVLNYLDQLATGVYQAIYDEEFVLLHMHFILTWHVESNLLDEDYRASHKLELDQFPRLLWLYDRWKKRPPLDDSGWQADLVKVYSEIAARPKVRAATQGAEGRPGNGEQT